MKKALVLVQHGWLLYRNGVRKQDFRQRNRLRAILP
jgi:hypothetical protein